MTNPFRSYSLHAAPLLLRRIAAYRGSHLQEPAPTQSLGSANSAPVLSTPAKTSTPEQQRANASPVNPTAARSPTANMTKEQIEEYKRQALLRYERDNNINDALRTKVNVAESAVSTFLTTAQEPSISLGGPFVARVQPAPLGQKNRARSRHNLVLASIDEWLIEGAKETDTEKAARSDAGQQTDDLFDDLDEFLSGDAPTEPTLSAPAPPPPPPTAATDEHQTNTDAAASVSASDPAPPPTPGVPPLGQVAAAAPAASTPSLLDALDVRRPFSRRMSVA